MVGSLRHTLLSEDGGPSYARSSTQRRARFEANSSAVKLCMLALGVSAFPVCETLLLQTTMFDKCFRWGPRFYGGSTLALFLPGFAVQVLQNRRDAAAELIVGSRLFALVRLMVGHALQMAVLALFFVLLHGDPSRWEGNDNFLAISFLVIGCCCAVVYGTSAQTVSLFPSEVHPWFFVGTYSVSIAIAPLNLATGELCDEASRKPYWDRIVSYYVASCGFQLAGMAAFVVLAYSGVGGAVAFSKKDAQLKSDAVATLRPKRASDSGWIVPRLSDGRITGAGLTPEPEPEQPQPKSKLESKLEWESGTERQPETELVDPAHQATPPHRHALLYIWRKSAFVAVTMAISLVQNLLACGIFSRLRVQGDIAELRTTMLYSFYISQCCGTLLVMVPMIKRALNATILMLIAVLRIPFLAAIFYYNNQSATSTDLIFRSDLQVAIIYSFYMLAGGVIFSQAFSLSADAFVHAADRAVSATVMSVVYYAGVVLCGMILIAL